MDAATTTATQRTPADLSRYSKEAVLQNETDVVVLREEETTDPKFGFRPQERPIDKYLNYGFVPLDKPQGPTSHEVVAWVRKMFSQEKAGHSGTLDPMVSGVLPIGLGRATKALSVLLLGPKEYVCVARIHDSVPRELLYKTISEFTGQIFQKPPQRSSVKRVTRTRTIYEIEVLEQQGNLILLRVLCEAGTYIRKLIYDIGEVISVGATMVELRRTRVCQILESDLVRLHDLFEANAILKETGNESRLRERVKPIEYAVDFLKTIKIRDSAVESICQGAQLAIPGIVSFSRGIKKGEIVRIQTMKGELVAIGEAQLDEEALRTEEHGLATLTKRVIMNTGTYPRMWKAKSDVLPAEEVPERLLQKSILDAVEAEAEGEDGGGDRN